MISESQYWKDDLAKNVQFIHKKLFQTVWRDSSYARLEKSIMVSCYIVRKLSESNHIPKELFTEPIKLYSYKNRGEPVSLSNSHKLDELYDIENAKEVSKPFSYVLNQIIHSYIFQYAFKDKKRIEGVIFNSDRSKEKEVYLLRLTELIRALSPIAQCYVGRAIVKINDKGEFVYVNSE